MNANANLVRAGNGYVRHAPRLVREAFRFSFSGNRLLYHFLLLGVFSLLVFANELLYTRVKS